MFVLKFNFNQIIVNCFLLFPLMSINLILENLFFQEFFENYYYHKNILKFIYFVKFLLVNLTHFCHRDYLKIYITFLGLFLYYNNNGIVANHLFPL